VNCLRGSNRSVRGADALTGACTSNSCFDLPSVALGSSVLTFTASSPRLVMMIQTWKAENDEKDDIKEQWLHIATVLDRILLIIFSIILSSVAVRLTTAPPME